MALQEFKCPNCGGAIKFDAEKQEMACPYCDSVIGVEALKQADYDPSKAQEPEEARWGYDGEGWDDGEQDGMAVYSCRSCGGEIVGDETLGSTSCPFCGNNVVMTSKFSGSLKPDAVIPFKVSREKAVEALRKHYLGKRLLPKAFKDDSHLEEVKGVYVPFWLFDADADACVEFLATRTRFWSDANYSYRETSHFRAVRDGAMRFADVPVDGSKAMDDTLMESIEPFDMTQATGFLPAYLSGFFANKYDVGAEPSSARANLRIKNSVESALAATVTGYDSVRAVGSSLRLSGQRVRYALLPVWLLCTRWRDKPFVFSMNGQTGLFVGDLPTDWGLFWRWFAGIFGAVLAVSLAVSLLIAG